MNPYGSYKKLLGNSVAAMSAAIEIYNKPKIEYRDETFVILLINGWELALKALLSKNKQRIYYSKKRNEPYRSYSITHALQHAQKHFPSKVDYRAVVANLEQVIRFRDNAIHFYNEPSVGVLVYALAQTSIVNYRDLLQEAFDYDLSSEITLSLLPLALAAPIDPVEFINAKPGTAKTSKAVQEYCDGLREVVQRLEDDNRDTGRFMTVFRVNLQSTKKIASSDFTVGVDSAEGGASGTPVLVTRKLDPNVSYPLRQKDIITSASDPSKPGMNLTVGGRSLTSHVFQTVIKHFGFKNDPKYCWRETNGAVTKYWRCYESATNFSPVLTGGFP